ncbi:hypothetical protein BDR04DRAFT_1157521 [Suillus decipiens]|nr:hypothetical protein BDR04DRAFT_1157521 [Suillus decipiens]
MSQDLFSPYHHLILKGFAAGNITITGDSTGGNMALILPYIILQSALPMPAHIALFSLDADLTYASYTSVPTTTSYLYQPIKPVLLNIYFPANGPLAPGILIPFTSSWPNIGDDQYS